MQLESSATEDPDMMVHDPQQGGEDKSMSSEKRRMMRNNSSAAFRPCETALSCGVLFDGAHSHDAHRRD